MSHKQLTEAQRYHIYGLWRAGYNQVQMAKEIGVHKSTISREFKRNSRWNGYVPGQAQWFCNNRRRKAKKCRKFTKEVEQFVHEKIKLEWSNENTNGLVRQYLKKGSDFDDVTDDDLNNIINKHNNRPRKSLGYATPDEIFNSCF